MGKVLGREHVCLHTYTPCHSESICVPLISETNIKLMRIQNASHKRLVQRWNENFSALTKLRQSKFREIFPKIDISLFDKNFLWSHWPSPKLGWDNIFATLFFHRRNIKIVQKTNFRGKNFKRYLGSKLYIMMTVDGYPWKGHQNYGLGAQS